MAAGMDLMDSLGKAAKPADEPSAAGDDAVMDVAPAQRSAAADGGAAAEARAEEVQARRLSTDPGLHEQRMMNTVACCARHCLRRGSNHRAPARGARARPEATLCCSAGWRLSSSGPPAMWLLRARAGDAQGSRERPSTPSHDIRTALAVLAM